MTSHHRSTSSGLVEARLCDQCGATLWERDRVSGEWRAWEPCEHQAFDHHEWCHSRAMAPGLLVCSCGAQERLDAARDAAGDHGGGG